MTDHDYIESVRNMRNRTQRLERQGDYWSDAEREHLRKMFHAGVGITEMAVILQRTEPAVIQQIEKMDLYKRKAYPARRQYICRKDHCHCKECTATKDECLHHIPIEER